MDYIDLKYKPDKKDLVAEFLIETPKKISMKEAANAVAGESSIGTWTELGTMNDRIRKTLKPTVFSIQNNTIKIAYPQELFEYGNIPEILSSVAGNIFSMKIVSSLKLMDMDFPEDILRSFPGPKFGIQGVRNILKVKDRPLVGTIIKPKLGLNSEEHAHVAYESWIGGLDIVKDDENLTSQKFNPFEKRVTETLKMLKKAEKETGEKKVYMPNITAESGEMLRRAKFVKEAGGTHIMVDIVTCGFSGLQSIQNANLGMVVHGHRAMHAAFTRNPRHGISMLVLAKLCRMVGIDQLHIGTIVGKMEGKKNEVIHLEEEIEEQIVNQDKKSHVLAEEWCGMKPMFAVCSGGLHPAMLPVLVKYLGKDIIAQFGGGVHGHPNGTKAGAMAVRQAAEAVAKRIDLEDYSKTHKELDVALKKWGLIR